jgi:hypothetical protein
MPSSVGGKDLMRATWAIIAGYALWTVLWLSGNFILRTVGALPKDPLTRIDSAGALGTLIGISILCSIAAGGIAAVISRGPSNHPALILAFLLLLTGLAVQWSVFQLMPIWYHVTFLALLIPLVLAGARLMKRA